MRSSGFTPPTVENVCFFGEISTSSRIRATAAITLSRLCDGSPMPMNTMRSMRITRRACTICSTISSVDK